jgi:antitoxin (DNA-binding transcriptional repressor) of toxin-antitoxin stability system
MKQISIQDLKARLSAAVAEAEAGRILVVTRHNTAVAHLGPPRPAHVSRADHGAYTRLEPALKRGTRGRYLKVLIEDRGER